MTTAHANDPTTCLARLEAAHSGRMAIALPGTDYLLDLAAGGPTGVAPGKRIEGTIEGRAQKLHRASAGGEFIEPVEGHPRIVQGRVRSSDPARRRLLVHAVVPMWITLSDGQSTDDFRAGDIVNFYMESGVTFTPRA